MKAAPRVQLPVESQTMLVESTRFGAFEVETTRTLRFQETLLGFPDSKSYVLIEVDDSAYVWLQSVDEPGVAFLAVPPFPFFPSYDLELNEEQQLSLGIEDPSQVEVLTLLTVHRAGETAEVITANLLGPIVINVESRQARQIVLEATDYTTREPLVA